MDGRVAEGERGCWLERSARETYRRNHGDCRYKQCVDLPSKPCWDPPANRWRAPLLSDDGSITAEEYSVFLHDLAAQEAVATQYELLVADLKDRVETAVSSQQLTNSPKHSPHGE